MFVNHHGHQHNGHREFVQDQTSQERQVQMLQLEHAMMVIVVSVLDSLAHPLHNPLGQKP